MPHSYHIMRCGHFPLLAHGISRTQSDSLPQGEQELITGYSQQLLAWLLAPGLRGIYNTYVRIVYSLHVVRIKYRNSNKFLY